MNALEVIGVTDQRLQQLQEWARTHSVTLRLSAEESCKYLRTVTRDVESATSHVTTWSGGYTRKDVVVTRVTEYFWQFTAKWELKAFKGTGAESVVLQSRTVCVCVCVVSHGLRDGASVRLQS